MAGLSNSEYRKQQEEKATLGKVIWQLIKLTFWVGVALVAPLLVLGLLVVAFLGSMVLTVIGGALFGGKD